jgi:hypothetical protein
MHRRILISGHMVMLETLLALTRISTQDPFSSNVPYGKSDVITSSDEADNTIG